MKDYAEVMRRTGHKWENLQSMEYMGRGLALRLTNLQCINDVYLFHFNTRLLILKSLGFYLQRKTLLVSVSKTTVFNNRAFC